MEKNPLKDTIKNLIKEKGPLSFGQFFDICLTDPKNGYYMN